MSERRYSARVGLSRGAIQKAKAAGRLVLHADGSIDAAASDARRAETTDPSKSRPKGAPARSGMKPVPDEAIEAVRDTLKGEERFRDSEAGSASGASGATNGMAAPVTGGGTTYLQAKTAHEVLKAQERRIRLAKLKGELVDRDRATALVFRLAREERDAWVNWPARVAALMAAKLGASISEAAGQQVTIETAAMQKVLEAHVRAHLEELAQPRIAL